MQPVGRDCGPGIARFSSPGVRHDQIVKLMNSPDRRGVLMGLCAHECRAAIIL
jgi:hypothetical protein